MKINEKARELNCSIDLKLLSIGTVLFKSKKTDIRVILLIRFVALCIINSLFAVFCVSNISTKLRVRISKSGKPCQNLGHFSVFL